MARNTSGFQTTPMSGSSRIRPEYTPRKRLASPDSIIVLPEIVRYMHTLLAITGEPDIPDVVVASMRKDGDPRKLRSMTDATCPVFQIGNLPSTLKPNGKPTIETASEGIIIRSVFARERSRT